MDILKTYPKLTQSNFMPIQMYVRSELDCARCGKLRGFQGSHFVCGDEGGMLVVGVCMGKYVRVFNWCLMMVTGCGLVYWDRVGVSGDVGGWVSSGQVA